MLHPPQEGSNRSLAYGALLGVYGRCTMPGSPMGRSEGSSRRWTGYLLSARNTKKNPPLHASRTLMVVLPCLDHP